MQATVNSWVASEAEAYARSKANASITCRKWNQRPFQTSIGKVMHYVMGMSDEHTLVDMMGQWNLGEAVISKQPESSQPLTKIWCGGSGCAFRDLSGSTHVDLQLGQHHDR